MAKLSVAEQTQMAAANRMISSQEETIRKVVGSLLTVGALGAWSQHDSPGLLGGSLAAGLGVLNTGIRSQ